MGFGIVLEDEVGNPVDRIDDLANLLDRLMPRGHGTRFVYTSVIDVYGDTTFNRMQMPRFLEEWRLLMVRAETPEELKLMEKVEAMAESVAGGVHLYLKFYGD